jgi:hypothetical protein
LTLSCWGGRIRYLYFGDLQIQPMHVRNVLRQRCVFNFGEGHPSR